MEVKETKSGGTDRTEPETQRLKEDLRTEHEMYLRALADFDNYRRRSEREREAAAQHGKRDILLPLLEILDGFDRAIEHIDDSPSSVSDGLLAIRRQLLGLLEAQGVTPLESLGETFDPGLHEAIGSVENDQYDPGVVAEVIQPGYRWGDDLLRPARVRVAR